MSEEKNPVEQFLEDNFTYHSPFGDQPTRYGKIRAQAKALAIVILGNTPAESREQGLALDALRSAVMWANASIACNEKDPGAVPAQVGEAAPSVAAPVAAPAHEELRKLPEPEAAPSAEDQAVEAPAPQGEAVPA